MIPTCRRHGSSRTFFSNFWSRIPENLRNLCYQQPPDRKKYTGFAAHDTPQRPRCQVASSGEVASWTKGLTTIRRWPKSDHQIASRRPPVSRHYSYRCSSRLLCPRCAEAQSAETAIHTSTLSTIHLQLVDIRLRHWRIYHRRRHVLAGRVVRRWHGDTFYTWKLTPWVLQRWETSLCDTASISDWVGVVFTSLPRSTFSDRVSGRKHCVTVRAI